MSLTDQQQETRLTSPLSTGAEISTLNQLKLRLSQLETQLSRLAIVYGLGYGCLQRLAPCFLQVKKLLLNLAQQQEQDSDLVDLAESLLTDASEHELCELENQLLDMRRCAQDPSKQQFAPTYQCLMNDLLLIEQNLQAALQRALGNMAG